MNKLIVFALILIMTTVLFAQDGTLKWKYKTGAGISSSPAIGLDGTVYVGSGDNCLYALNPDGTLKWRYETGGHVHSSPAVSNDSTVYVGSSDHYLYSLSLDGSLKWRYETGSVISSSPAIGMDGLVYVGSRDECLYVLNTDGAMKWWRQTGDWISSSPAVGLDGTVYVGSLDDYLYALNSDYSLKWRYRTGYNVISSPAIGADGTVYMGSMDNCLYALNPDGSLKWKYQTGYWIESSPAVGVNGTVYIGSRDYYLYALNPDGSLKWQYETGYYVDSSPAIGADGTVYLGSDDSYLYALNPDGILKWRYKTGNGINSSPAVGEDGTVYIGSEDGYLYAISTDCGGLAKSAWPMLGNNTRHTGLFSAPFHWSVTTLSFQLLTGDYTKDKIFITAVKNAQIISCCFDNTGFYSDISLPVTVTAGQTFGLAYKVQGDTISGIYHSACTIGWQTLNDLGAFSLSLSQGVIYQDGSESSVVGTQVLAAYDSSYVKDPKSIATKNNEALLYRICGDPETADQILAGIEAEALQDCYCSDVYLLNRGVTRSDLNNPETAAICYNGILNNDSKTMNAKAWYNCGWEAYHQADYGQVILYTDSVIAASMVNECTLAKAWCLRGAALVRLGEYLKADTAFIRSKQHDTNGPIGDLADQNRDCLNAPVKADFNADTEIGNPPFIVRFFGNASGAITSWLWDFGDGNTSTLQNPEHIYLTADTFTVCLIVQGLSTSDTCVQEKYILVTISTDAETNPAIPEEFRVYANYPNPFNPSTNIVFDLPEPGVVTVSVYNTLGQRVRILHQGRLEAGQHTLQWNARDDQGRWMGSGIYLLRVSAEDRVEVRKMTLMR